MIKNIIYVEDGSIDVDELSDIIDTETTYICVYRQGSKPPEVKHLDEGLETWKEQRPKINLPCRIGEVVYKFLLTGEIVSFIVTKISIDFDKYGMSVFVSSEEVSGFFGNDTFLSEEEAKAVFSKVCTSCKYYDEQLSGYPCNICKKHDMYVIKNGIESENKDENT